MNVCHVGAYILSPLEEGSRDPVQNAGFIITWRNANQDTRVTSYSIRNTVEQSSPSSSPHAPASTQADRAGRGSGQLGRRDSQLSRILSRAATTVSSSDLTFAAFKALPIDPARSRRENGSFFEPADELTGANNCREAVDMMVDAIHRACVDIGNDSNDFIKEGDVVSCVFPFEYTTGSGSLIQRVCTSLTEAQKMTSVYAKMEYGVKRLLWLGG